ncbi:leucine--tRNA ligase [Haladaptatus caseinilyticus]|uniref:leucine--tRNA ligase n=1 Tax=Haladaptatus caseinilyticus TaxID=2993314 RepID=UPI00224B9159|nr:leucine--tRNA ligase [Haladaptatus caseinilyticus]
MSEEEYDHAAIERRWQEVWDEREAYRTSDNATDPTYVLGMFPYPSGKLHMGHVRNYTITDAFERYRRMCGDDVLHPMGWDSFGLPAENAAKERDTDPREWTLDCIDTMRGQMKSMGFGYDWDREITTCEPEYYRWNQWLFQRFHDEGLVERKAAEVNWCPSCQTVLADEQVEGEDDHCWRCETVVEQRELDQWTLAITEYADELLEAIDELDGWPDSVRQMQRNWIGKNEGTALEFSVEGYGPVEAFTTRVDTVFGAAFFALAPDHSIAQELANEDDGIRRFIEEEADPDGDEPNGVETGLTATNPATGEELPVFVADFVLSDVGTGALMGVPGHDDRDHVFASKMGVNITPVVAPESDEPEAPDVSESAFTEDGVLVNSDEYSGLTSAEARERLTADIESATFHTQYRLRDWLISRQRYWGTPIPVIHCDDCGPVMVPEDELPVELPEFVNTTGNPLDAAEEWKHVECPDCGADATRETDTMDTFIDSSWYYLRYISPDFEDAPFETDRANDWMPVDQYVGGIEHAVMHLLYARFVTKAISDLGMLDHREPFTNLLAQGMVQLEGEKMSKSKGNTVSPQRIVEEYGADTARLFMMQAAQPERDFDWSEEGVRSTNRFLTRLKATVDDFDPAAADGEDDSVARYVRREIDTAVAVATDEYEELTFNVALREAQDLVGTLRTYQEFTDVHAPTFERGLTVATKLLAPVTPHIAEELYDELGHDGLVVDAEWPSSDVEIDDAVERRQLIQNTREDVRNIVDVAGIEEPERVDVVVTPEWKYRAREIAITSDADNLISELMQEGEIREHGDVAASYGQDLQAEREALTHTLTPESEYEVLQQATWLIEQEFDAPVRILSAEEADDDVVRKAEPGRPAIDIQE